jgi:endoglucanase
LPDDKVSYAEFTDAQQNMNKAVLTFLGSILFGFAFTFSSLADIQYAGVNLSGAEFGVSSSTPLPGTFGSAYTWPTNGETAYYQSRGMNFIRLPFRWERLQITNSATLDPVNLGRMSNFVYYATSHGMYVLLDPHNFMRYYPTPINSFQTATTGLVGNSNATYAVSYADFSNFWYQVAVVFQNNNHVFFGLNNEPDSIQETQLVAALNFAIAGIRNAGATNMIFVPGNGYTGAWTWLNSNGSFGAANSVAMLGIVDPGNNYCFEVHQYLDSNGSGSNDGIVSTDIGWQRLTNFTAWARANNVKGFLGEYGAPGNTFGATPDGGAALTNMLSYISTNSDVWLGWCYWGGGPWWGSNPTFPVEPANPGNPTDKTTVSIIKEFTPLPVPTLQIVNNNTQFQYPAPQGFVYQVQYSTDLTSSNNWTNLGSAITNVQPPGPLGPSTNAPFTVNLGSDPQGFYRVVVSHAP